MTILAKTEIESAWSRPLWEVLCVIGYIDGVQQIARLENRGRMTWTRKSTAERHAAEYQAKHGRLAYASETL